MTLGEFVGYAALLVGVVAAVCVLGALLASAIGSGRLPSLDEYYGDEYDRCYPQINGECWSTVLDRQHENVRRARLLQPPVGYDD